MEKTKQTIFKQTQAEFTALKKDAHKHEMNISEYIRWLIEKERAVCTGKGVDL